jgi:hypothetical protein
MFKILTILSLFGISFFSIAQNVGIGTQNPKARLHVVDSNVLFSANWVYPENPGDPPASGIGKRMMWYADKGAFRAGVVTGQQWDKDNIGINSFASGNGTTASGIVSAAFGQQTIASGIAAFAMGTTAKATGFSSIAGGSYTHADGWGAVALGDSSLAMGDYSAAIGYRPKAIGNFSMALGYRTEALDAGSIAIGTHTKANTYYSQAIGFTATTTGFYSTSIGTYNTASGNYSTAMGVFNTSRAFAGFTAGMYNDSIAGSNPSLYIATDPLFMIGNGTDNTNRSNALMVLKNGNTGLGTNSPKARLHVADSNVLFSATGLAPENPGNPPISGNGRRMMWYADKAAFRVGYALNNEWDKENVGRGSIAMGTNSLAKGDASVALAASSDALGVNSLAAIGGKAYGDFSAAIGWYATTYGKDAISMGNSNWAIGEHSVAFGEGSIASGTNAITLGEHTVARAYSSTVIGRFNDSIINANQTEYVATDPIFIIGNGQYNNRKNAMMVLKNGNTGIGTNTPQTKLHITGGLDATYSDNTGFLVVGDVGGANIAIDNNEILARSNGGPSNLFLQAKTNSGHVILNSVTGNTGIGTSTPTAKLHIAGGSVVAMVSGTAPGNPSNPPVSGVGRRMMWYADKAAFRSGYVSGGQWDNANVGLYSIAGGFDAKATGYASTAFGTVVESTGNYSVALGRRVGANGIGSFIFGDSDPNNKGLRTSISDNLFWTRFNGGYYLVSSDIGADIGVRVLPGGNSWTTISDINMKENFIPVNGEAILEKFAAIPQYTWNYKGQDPATFRHYGPMAQDFYKAFGRDELGTIGCDTLINQHDFIGVSMVAIQALEKRTSELTKLLEQTLLELEKTKMELMSIKKQ